MNIARGEVWRVRIGSFERAVVVVESDPALFTFPRTAVVLMIDETGQAPDSVVTVPLTDPVKGVAVAVDIASLRISTVVSGEFLGVVAGPDMQRVDRALRVALDLT
ncbi:type II toxin-antitoxin system PemK/MazF family toxin [Streptomyces sp. GQFP]|uniref:type II toxin-antitoxin system PemK/MazF family toxin n=1 Tax=Streptomyces sp. GQFP TaxID=2907545 RepID=UPI001F26C196|nr:type II toxin-antitoxin system PemK/MazF family toxin [Streptomyces sp. GQFP]UIX32985.1 hypothetical protein LUX31_24875 [Streptomyces sp. GQFP]